MSSHRIPSLAARRSKGIALIEAMVGMLIFSIGILGLVGLQAAMNRAQGSAKFRSEAIQLANDLVGQMWTDRANLTGGKYMHPGDCSAHVRCADWLQKLSTTLPGGQAVVSTTSAGTVTMTVTWTLATEGTHTYAISTAVR